MSAPILAPVGALLVLALVVQSIRVERLREALRRKSSAWTVEAILTACRETREVLRGE